MKLTEVKGERAARLAYAKKLFRRVAIDMTKIAPGRFIRKHDDEMVATGNGNTLKVGLRMVPLDVYIVAYVDPVKDGDEIDVLKTNRKFNTFMDKVKLAAMAWRSGSAKDDGEGIYQYSHVTNLTTPVPKYEATLIVL